MSELSRRTVNYGYDSIYRLANETIASDPHGINGAVNYTYDPVGNRKQLASTLAPVPAGLWNYDANDRIEKAGVSLVGACPERSRRNAFGNLIHSSTMLSTPTLNNYLFAGEQFDPD